MVLSVTSMMFLLLSTLITQTYRRTSRKEKIGKIYHPAAGLSTETIPYYTSAYDMDMRKVIDVYAAATEHRGPRTFTHTLHA